MKVLTHDEAIRLSEYRSGAEFDDCFSGIHRPGSWEWALPTAAAARDRLRVLGYEAQEDPEASWRVRWVQS